MYVCRFKSVDGDMMSQGYITDSMVRIETFHI